TAERPTFPLIASDQRIEVFGEKQRECRPEPRFTCEDAVQLYVQTHRTISNGANKDLRRDQATCIEAAVQLKERAEVGCRRQHSLACFKIFGFAGDLRHDEYRDGAGHRMAGKLRMITDGGMSPSDGDTWNGECQRLEVVGGNRTLLAREVTAGSRLGL